jgi:hypothetical protein
MKGGQVLAIDGDFGGAGFEANVRYRTLLSGGILLQHSRRIHHMMKLLARLLERVSTGKIKAEALTLVALLSSLLDTLTYFQHVEC